MCNYSIINLKISIILIGRLRGVAMKILFAINLDVIQANIIDNLRHRGVELDYNAERDSVFSKELIIEKVKYNLNSQDSKYDIAIINEKLDGDFDLIEIVRFLSRNNIRPIMLLGNRSEKDPLIHALIKRKEYNFLYGGKLKIDDIISCVLKPRKYQDIEHLVDINAADYEVQGKRIIDGVDTGKFQQNQFQSGGGDGPVIRPPGLGEYEPKKSPSKFSAFSTQKSEPKERQMSDYEKSKSPERVVVQQQYVAQLPDDYKKNIVIYSNQQVGKSFVASNIAATFAANGQRTALVDMDFKNKSQYYYFDMSKFEAKAKNPNDINIIEKVFEHGNNHPNDLLDKIFNPYKNLYVITSHPDLNVVDYDIDDLYRVYMLLKNMFDIVVYDLPGVCSENYLKLLMTESDDIFIITNQNCSILDRTEKDFRDVLIGYYVNNKISLVINQYIDDSVLNSYSIGELKSSYIRDHLSVIETKTKKIDFNFKNVFTIPNNYNAVVEGIAKGKPAVMLDDNLKNVFEKISNKYYPNINYKGRG